MREVSQIVTVVNPPAMDGPAQDASDLSHYQLSQRSINSALPDSQLPKQLSRRDSPRRMVTGLNHFNITASTMLIEQVKHFYRDILGLTVGPRAHLDHGGYWLYAGDSPILHLSDRPDIEEHTVTCRGFFNHISLSCTGLEATIKQLVATGTPFRVTQLADLGQTQIFITDPAGIGVELTFFKETL